MVSSMMVTFRIRDHFDSNVLAGATLGERHLAHLLQGLPSDVLGTTTVIVDLDGIAGATGSYLRAFIARGLRGRLVSDDPTLTMPDAATWELFVANVCQDVAVDLRCVLAEAGLVCLEALQWDAARVRKAKRHGDLDPAVGIAFKLLLSAGAATVAELAEIGRRERMDHRDHRIGTTAWHYRLGELLKLGLVRRSKAARSWTYEPTATEVLDG
jgi:hypothetical protein